MELARAFIFCIHVSFISHKLLRLKLPRMGNLKFFRLKIACMLVLLPKAEDLLYEFPWQLKWKINLQIPTNFFDFFRYLMYFNSTF